MSYHYAEMMSSVRKQMEDFANGPLLVALRSERRLAQAEAAHSIGVSEKSLRAWEKGGRIRPGNARRVAEFYNIEPGEVIIRDPARLIFNGDQPTELPEEVTTRLAAIEEAQAEMVRLLRRLEARIPPKPKRRAR